MECLKNGTCKPIESSQWDILSDDLILGTSLSVFITTVEGFLSIVVICSIPTIRKDSAFLYLCIFMAPFIVSTCTKACFLIIDLLKIDISDYYIEISTITSHCYEYFVTFSEFGVIIHSLICLKIHLSKKLTWKTTKRLPYLVIFCAYIPIHEFYNSHKLLDVLYWLKIVGLISAAGLSFLVFLFPSRKNTEISNREIRYSRNRIFWNIFCVLASTQEFLKLYILHEYKIKNLYSLTYVFESLGGVIYVLLIFILLPIMRNTIFHCCYPSEITEQDRIFLLNRSMSDRGSVSTVSSSSVAPTRVFVTSTLPVIQ
ncbi:unnamed protein product [Caenorhabditis angaria]|uniref:Uncharacterized protein n=1 Tax=Caenorhabditis angaria TaxID=860376 RepID=A0A9P1NAX9_9PELO|nr:unnamed protein product [Caenorhabditis angaria]